MKFIVIDNFASEHCQVEAATADKAAEQFVSRFRRLADCISPVLVQHGRPVIPGGICFTDEATKEGWGPGCKFAGQRPQAQVTIEVIPRI